MKRRADPLGEIVRQLHIQNALIAALTYQRTGVRPAGFDHLALPDPWSRLVPYAKALLLIRLAQRPPVAPSIVDALHDLAAVTAAIHPPGATPQGEPQMSTNAKEAIYDAEISPLMVQVIAICKRAGIPIHASFQLDEDLACTTHIAPERADVPEGDRAGFDTWAKQYDRAARRAVGDAAREAPLMITTRGADGVAKSITMVIP